MALKSPAFRKKFPLLVTGGLLAMQPLATPMVYAAEQYDCSVSAAGAWDCKPRAEVGNLPPRPVREDPASAAPGAAVADADAKPKQVTEAKGRGLRSRSTDYSHLDWVPRDKLTPAQLAEAGPYCAGSYIEPTRPGMNDKTSKKDSPTFIGAKASRYDQDSQVATLAGDVVMRQGSMQIEADEASLNQAQSHGELTGNVKLRDNGALLVGDHATVQMDTGEAQVDNAEYVLHQQGIRGSALYAKRAENSIIRLKDGTYTSCEPSSNAWEIKGNNITLNPATGFGTATNATLRVKDIPILYTPYIYFPIDKRRQSGFLPPSFGTGSDTGFTLMTPYYFNLAPNYDATVYPRYMAKRGMMVEGEFRYLTPSSEGQLGAAYLNDQDDERDGQSDATDQRYMLHWEHQGGLSDRISTRVDYTKISDPYYFQDLSTNESGIGNTDYVNQQGVVNYRGDTFNAMLNVQKYQLANVSDTTPYDRLPQLLLTGALPEHPFGLNFAYKAEAVRFQRDLLTGNYTDEDGNVSPRLDNNVFGLARANGNRFSVSPTISLPMQSTYGFVKPSLKYVYTQYDLDLDSEGKANLLSAMNQQAGYRQSYDSSPSLSIPVASIDSGLYFDRNTNWFGTNYRQTLEPRAYYLYVPYRNQNDIPVFDTGENTFDFASLFRDNRFSGSDRVGDENKLSLGVTSRWIQDNGFERQRYSIGQAIYFADRKVQLPGIDYDTRKDAQTNQSPIAQEYEYRFNKDWRFTGNLNWDPDTDSTRSGAAMFHYQPANDPNKVVNFGYRYRNDLIHYDASTGKWQVGGGDYGTPGQPGYIKDYYKIQQHDFSVIWPVVPKWNAIARWEYDYNRQRTLEAFGGFEYDNCCWKMRLITRYWVDYDETSQLLPENEKGDRGVFLQIVLKGLGGIVGTKVDSFLDKGIEGYREREDQAN
ncbi:LPS-assembly protein LptD [Pseudomonas sp. dw_358]|uniref:LPS-assembly protein LptD n=1 Tax=Pseudomonas sp. dw_358 TaxID=2720083 RepID=UPI001BD1CE38|nr:LPS-assembly protein LptD [Pseudomonas sp. dw_358]